MESLGVPRATAPRSRSIRARSGRLFAEHYYLFRGTPTGVWLDHELHELFGVRVKLDGATAQRIYDEIREQLASPEFRPRALFERFNIEVLATTDAASDPLEHHRAIRESGWEGRVIPTFRPDAVFRIATPAWRDEIAALERRSGHRVRSYQRFIAALEERRAFFHSLGRDGHRPRRGRAVHGAASGRAKRSGCSSGRARGPRRRTTSALRSAHADGDGAHVHRGRARHAAAPRRAARSQRAHRQRFGPDKGADIPVATEYTRNLRALLNAYGNDPRLTLVLFTLDESTYARELAPLAGHYPALRLGPAVVVPRFDRGDDALPPADDGDGGIYNTAGFNDDTRAFCSIPARHDLSRRVDANFLAGLVARHVIDMDDARADGARARLRPREETYRFDGD